jgi:hypothetical protein
MNVWSFTRLFLYGQKVMSRKRLRPHILCSG